MPKSFIPPSLTTPADNKKPARRFNLRIDKPQYKTESYELESELASRRSRANVSEAGPARPLPPLREASPFKAHDLDKIVERVIPTQPIKKQIYKFHSIDRQIDR